MALSLQRYTYSDFSTGLNHIVKERSEKERERSTILAIKIGDNLPENVIVEILSRLPVKDLLQFKSVNKLWYAIISSPDFVSKHLKNYYNNTDIDSDVLLVQYYVSHAELQLFELLIDENHRAIGDEILYEMPMYGSQVCGPCDGIYYLYNYEGGERALWNPVLNELKVLPSIITKPDLPSHLTYAKNEVYGFGYDPKTEDYKVVVIKGYWNESFDDEREVTHPSSVLVYSLNTDSWKYCGDLAQKYDMQDNKCYVFVNGCFYWLGSCEEPENSNSELIISFDMGNNAIGEIQIPNYDQPASKSLGIYDNSLAFFAVHENEKRFEIWTLSSEGLWTKKFTTGLFPDIARPLGIWKKNKVLLECDDTRLVLCDTETEEIKDLGFQRDCWCQSVIVYRESLLSVKKRK